MTFLTCADLGPISSVGAGLIVFWAICILVWSAITVVVFRLALLPTVKALRELNDELGHEVSKVAWRLQQAVELLSRKGAGVDEKKK